MTANRAMTRIEVVCPGCGEIYERMVEKAHLNSPYIRLQSGYPVIYHEGCKPRRHRKEGGK